MRVNQADRLDHSISINKGLNKVKVIPSNNTIHPMHHIQPFNIMLDISYFQVGSVIHMSGKDYIVEKRYRLDWYRKLLYKLGFVPIMMVVKEKDYTTKEDLEMIYRTDSNIIGLVSGLKTFNQLECQRKEQNRKFYEYLRRNN